MALSLRLCALAFVAAACTPTKLLKATSEFSRATAAATGEVRNAPDVLGELCRARIDLDYLEHRLTPGTQTGPLEDYRVQPFPTAGGHATITWKQRCEGLQRADAAFLRGVMAIERYGIALGGFANEAPIEDAGMQALAKKTADDVAQLGVEAQPYREAIAGLGTPLATIARAIEGEWKGKKLEGLITRANEPLHAVITRLQEFIRVVRRRHLHDVRAALRDVVQLMDGTRAASDLPSLVLTSRFDIEMTHRLDELDTKLGVLNELLETIAVAHAELEQGWRRGESHGLATLKTVGTFARDLHGSVKAFRSASKGAP